MAECLFKNFKKCFIQEKIGNTEVNTYDSKLCVACMLARIEKQLFTLLNGKKEHPYNESRGYGSSSQTETRS